MLIKTLAPWFGSNRDRAEVVGRELGKLAWCGVPFMGGAPELPHIDTRAGIANDLHCLVINLAKVVADPDLCVQMVDLLDCMLFHPAELEAAQAVCMKAMEEPITFGLFGQEARTPLVMPDVPLAAAYFACCWMGRGGHAGKGTEFTQGLAVRWTASGGDSALRFQNAIKSLPAWHKALKVWSFERIDAREFLERVRDEEGFGLYLDPPWPDAGLEYRHKETTALHVKIAEMVRRFKKTRVVVRYGDVPFIRECYPDWTWLTQTTTNQKGNDVAEALIINGPSYSVSCGGGDHGT